MPCQSSKALRLWGIKVTSFHLRGKGSYQLHSSQQELRIRDEFFRAEDTTAGWALGWDRVGWVVWHVLKSSQAEGSRWKDLVWRIQTLPTAPNIPVHSNTSTAPAGHSLLLPWFLPLYRPPLPLTSIICQNSISYFLPWVKTNGSSSTLGL